MKFFTDYINSTNLWQTIDFPKGLWYGNELIQGEFNLKNEKDYNRALNGDSVQLNDDGKIINVIRKEGGHKIVGVLKLFGKHKLSPNAKGVATYNFQPRDKRYPCMTVCSNILKGKNPPTENVFCVVEFLEWTTEMKIPRGTIYHIIGEISDDKNNFIMNMWNRNLYRKTPKLPKEFELTDFNNQRREDYTNKTIFSIDPPGCIDIDDAFHICEKPNGSYEIGVHISDVSSYICENSPLDIMAQQNSTSIYLPHEKHNMLPSQLADDALSLHEGKPRSAFTTNIFVNAEGEITDFEFKHTRILNRKAYNYDEANLELTKEVQGETNNDLKRENNNEVSQSLRMLFNLYEKMMTKFNFNSFAKDNPNKDTHDLVEYFMVLTNHIVCKYLQINSTKYPSNFINRIHKSPDLSRMPDGLAKSSVRLGNFMYRRCMSAAEYSTNKGEHFGLSIDQYLHFTSPIRRYADVLAHRFLDEVIQEHKLSSEDINDRVEKTNQICQHMNQTAKRIKQLERDNQKVIISHDLPKEGKEFMGNIINIGEDDEGNMNVEIYIPELDFSKDICLWKKSMAHCIHLSQLSDDEYEFFHGEEVLRMKLYDEVKIKIIPSTQSASIGRKMRIMWLEPDVSGFLMS